MIEGDNICLDEVQIFSDDRRDLMGELKTVKDARSEMERLGSEEKSMVLGEMAESYWKESYIEVISVIANDTEIEISDEVRSEAVAVLEELNEQIKAVKEKCELQKQLFSKYDEVYSMYIGGITE